MKKCETSVAALAAEIAKWLTSMGGSTIEALRRARREFLRRLKDAEPHMVIELAERLLDVPRMGFRFVAYELLHHHRGALSELNAPQLERLGRGMASWGAVDCFGVYLAGPVWRKRQVPNRLIHGRARAKDRWWRRAALVSTVPLSSKARSGTGEAPRTRARRLPAARARPRSVVAKALSWALRELAKRDPRADREYIAKRKDGLPAIVLREVKNKLRTGLKNPKKR